MKTTHQIIYESSCDMNDILHKSIDLVVTSPPYPMVEMWDEQFMNLNIDIKKHLQQEDGISVYLLMHQELNKVWKEMDKVLKPGGIVCINIGDATRKIGDSFQIYSNHSRIINYFENIGYHILPSIIWKKTSNKPNKFMGSGMLPTNAYVTLEHEHILIFRKGKKRIFTLNEQKNRQKSTYFWEERNDWFSDIWNVKGMTQKLGNKNVRERSGAYPFELVYRLINMYSVQGDTILDPFMGTGTTMLAAMCAMRNSVGYEIDKNLSEIINNRLDTFLDFSNKIISNRLINHIEFVKKRLKEGKEFKYESSNYGFPIMTKQEEHISFPSINKIKKIDINNFNILYTSLKRKTQMGIKPYLNRLDEWI